MFSTHTVSELLFEGYHEPLIKIARALPLFQELKLPNFDRFGWYYERNGTTDFAGAINMGTGINSTLGKIYNWEYDTKTQFFHENCSDVSGYSGQFFPSDLKPENLLAFSMDLRRKLPMQFDGTEMVDNVLGYKYIPGDQFFDNGTIFPENSCFCNGECVPYGMVNLSTTRHQFPIFLSLPHFFQADSYYLDLIDGLKPDKNKHESMLIIEPTTGIPIEMRAKAQLNLLIRPVEGIPLVENTRKIFVPVFWTKQDIKLTGTPMFLIKLIINLPFICTALGCLIIGISFVSIFLLFSKRSQKKVLKKLENDVIIDEEELGPYTFIQNEEKCNVTWNDNGTVTYREKKIWKHQGGNLDDVVVGVNYVTLGTTDFAGAINMGTGINSTLGKIYNWEYDTKTHFFHENCSDVSGYSGQFFPSDLQPENLLAFSPDLRRKLPMQFAGTEMVDNVLGYKYIAGDQFLDNGTNFPENSCFCNGECVPYGMVNLSTTRHQFPVFFSLPHFFRTDPYYLDLIDGLKPDKNKHESMVIVEPTTGIPIEMRAKAQLNLLIRPVKGIPLVENSRKIFVPVFWTKQNVKLTGAPMYLIKLIINLPIICTSLGCLMIVISFVSIALIIKQCRKKISRKYENNVIKDEEVPLN
ncbi:uncharacterized protein LOC123010073 [Tribolium madens]|uniref:uncharacterized protein LOC123010073 n=1 Tax=Tribolium madens TaxID=41895 RepID=UPI001CF72CF0|nr:uncharacterized protein LOC123010073 [Tribolium madens]